MHHAMRRPEAVYRRAAMAPPLARGEIGRLLGWMPYLVRDGDLTEWERSFAASIVNRTKSPRFRPSAKQLAIIRRLVEDFHAPPLMGDGEVIED